MFRFIEVGEQRHSYSTSDTIFMEVDELSGVFCLALTCLD